MTLTFMLFNNHASGVAVVVILQSTCTCYVLWVTFWGSVSAIFVFFATLSNGVQHLKEEIFTCNRRPQNLKFQSCLPWKKMAENMVVYHFTFYFFFTNLFLMISLRSFYPSVRCLDVPIHLNCLTRVVRC